MNLVLLKCFHISYEILINSSPLSFELYTVDTLVIHGKLVKQDICSSLRVLKKLTNYLPVHVL